MSAPFDLNLLPFYRVKGQEWPQLPGLRVFTPPRRTARGREEDQLIIYLTLAGNTPFPTAEYNQLTARLAEQFYKTSGALTSALHAGADALNQLLVERNMRTTGQGKYVVGRLVLGALRGSQMLIGQSGPTHVFHMSGSESQHLHEEQSAKSGLGASQITPIRFLRLELHPGDLLVFCSALPTGWENALNIEFGSFENLKRRLLSVSKDDLNAVLIQVLKGKGGLNILHGVTSTGQARPGSAPPARPVAEPPAPSPVDSPMEEDKLLGRPVSQVVSEQPASRFTRLLSGEAAEPPAEERPAQTAEAGPQPAEEATSRPASPGSSVPRTQISRPSRFVSPPAAEGEIPEISRPVSPKRQVVFRGLAKWLRGVRVLSHNLAQKFKAFLPNLFPDLREDEPHITGLSMGFIAIVIPLLVVMIAMTFYNKHGKTTSYQENYDQAWAASVWASEQTDPADIRVGWERTLYYLDTADNYQETEELRELRQRAQLALDNLDSILRLDFGPAIVGGLSQTVVVSHLAATTTDLYLLDATRGSVQRYYLGAQGYQNDAQFSCQPGEYDGIHVGEIIDIMAAPKVNGYNATVYALDASGTLLACRPSPLSPTVVGLATPSLGLQEAVGFTLDETDNYLFLLDPQGNAIWSYAPYPNGKYTNLPVMFFSTQVPAGMPLAIDLATNGADLYILFSDGHVTVCTLLEAEGDPGRCSDPAQFIDSRPDRVNGTTISDAFFTQMTFTETPDQALYLFDPQAQAVYRFSPRTDSIILLGQFRASEEDRVTMLDTTATAMNISPNRYIFIAVNGQVYYAADVP